MIYATEAGIVVTRTDGVIYTGTKKENVVTIAIGKPLNATQPNPSFIWKQRQNLTLTASAALWRTDDNLLSILKDHRVGFNHEKQGMWQNISHSRHFLLHVTK